MNENRRTSSTMPFGYGKIKSKIKNKGITPQRKREVKKHEQTVSADLQEKEMIVAPSPILMSISTSTMKMISNNLFLIMHLM